MTFGERVNLDGDGQYVRKQGADRRVIRHRSQWSLTGDRVVNRITDHDTEKTETITSDNRAVIHFITEWDAMLVRQARRHEEVTSEFKSRKRAVADAPRMPEGFDWCPLCLGCPEGSTICDYCNGDRIMRVEDAE